MRFFARFFFLLLVLFSSPVFAQDGEAIRAVRLAPGEVLRLDGTLSHPAWQRAPVFARFIEKDPVNGAAPPQATKVQVVFDEQALYVGITALDTAPERIRDEIVRADNVRRTQDFVAVYIDAIGSRQSAQFFRVNAAGSTGDGLHTASDDSEDFSPDFDWDAATARNPQGWTAVLRLPFASLRFAAGRPDWKIMVVRRLPREQFHMMVSVAIPRDAPSFIARMQPLLGVELPQDHAFLTVRPSLTLRRETQNSVRKQKADASLDVKWRPRAELLIDATLNPDFSQVALDVPQLAGNTRFALSFPEKRPFFFESADLLRSPTDAFYTRSFTAPRWGLRGTWRGAELAGSSFIVDDRGGGLVLLPGPYGTDAVEQPASKSVAARIKNDRGELQLGGLLVSRRYSNSAGENTVVGPDLGWQIDAAWRVRAQWLRSQTNAFTDRQQISGDRVFAKIWRQTEDDEFNISLDDGSRGFRHDTGFVNQVGVRHIAAYAQHGWHGLAPFNEFFLNLLVEQTRDRATGRIVAQDFRPGLWSSAANNLEWWLELHPQSLIRTAANAPLLHERYVGSGIDITPATWLPLFSSNISIGQLADTVDNRVRPGVRLYVGAKLRPVMQLELEPSITLAWLRDGGRMVYRESAAQWLAVWHFDARNNLRAIVQRGSLNRRSTAARDASQVDSVTYTWRQSAGTLLYIGASRSRFGVDTPVRGNEVFVKLQFDLDEARTRF